MGRPVGCAGGHGAAGTLQALDHYDGPVQVTGHSAESELDAFEERILSAGADWPRSLVLAQDEGATLLVNGAVGIAELDLRECEGAGLHGDPNRPKRALGLPEVDARTPGSGLDRACREHDPALTAALRPGVRADDMWQDR